MNITMFRKRVQRSGRESDRWAFLSPFDIPAKDGSGDIYLHRFRIIKTPWFGVYVHDLNLPDTDRDPHDHPWVFWSIVLRGGYQESIFEQVAGRSEKWRRITGPSLQRVYTRRWNRWSWHKMTRDVAHKINSVAPKTKTLVITGRRRRSWGFWTKDGFVNWRLYVRRYYGGEM